MQLASKTVQIVKAVDISGLPDDVLWQRTAFLAADERAATADLIEHLAAVDERELWKKKDYTSMFEYCVFGLRFSEAAAYKRIRAARAVRISPSIGAMLRDGRLSLEAVVMLHPHLKAADAAALLLRSCGLRQRQLEALLSDRAPQDTRREVVRFVGSAPSEETSPQPDNAEALPFNAIVDTLSPMFAAASIPPPPPPAVIPEPAPPTPRLVRFAFTADEDFYKMLERARALLRHKYPDGRLEGVLRDALKLLIERRDPVIRWEARVRRKKDATA